jgi:PEP-CTERM motif-containing protein
MEAKMRLSRFLLAVTLLSLAIGPMAFADTINFDGLADGTVVNTFYTASNGVTFSCVACSTTEQSGPDIYARNVGTQAASGTNVVSLMAPFGQGNGGSSVPAFDARFGGVEATFTTLQQSVSIDAAAVLLPEFAGTPVNDPFLEAFDSSGNLLAKVLYPVAYGSSTYGSYQTLSYTSTSANIAYVILSSQHDSGPTVLGQFDNLTFGGSSTGGNGGGGGTTVPEPSSVMLLGTSLAGLALRQFKNRN